MGMFAGLSAWVWGRTNAAAGWRIRIAVVLLCLLPLMAPAAEDAGTLLVISQKGSVLGTFSLAGVEAAGAVAVTVEDDSGQSSDYTGVPVAKLLESVGVSLGKSVRGERLAEFVMVRAVDSYRVLFSLAEIDPIFRERTPLLCYRKNGSPLPGKEGPLRIVVVDDKRHARWVRQVTAIELGRVDEPSAAH
jgi:DMSO/TMAO reductase YedYZ molybdopterin-dependent catalytic subunit